VRILFLCHRIPYPPDKGEKIRAFHQLRAIAARHEVDLFTLADDPRDLVHREALLAYCKGVTVARVFPKLARIKSLPYLLTRTPLTIPYFYSAQLQAEVCRAVAQHKYDRVFVYCSAMAQYVQWSKPGFRVASAPNPVVPVPIVMDMVDVDSNKWAQYAAATTFPFSAVFRKEGRDLGAYEKQVCADSACVLVATEREAQLARQISPTARVHVVPIGVDTEYFAPRQRPGKGAANAIIFTGDMGYFPNQDGVLYFAREVLPLIRRDIPDVRFLVVGRNPGRPVEDLRHLLGVEVTGFVPDVRPWFAHAAVAVAPLRIAAGIQTKILEAMASALPVVATPRAIQGLTKPIADMVESGDTPDALADKVLRLLKHPDLASQKGAECRRLITAEYGWTKALERLLHLIDDPSDGGSKGTDVPQPGYADQFALTGAPAVGH
jgi:polysaccharide biosynthesis protein PslH